MKVAQEDDSVLLLSQDGKRFLIRLRPGFRFHSHKGIIDHDSLIGQPLGREIRSHLDYPFTALRPSLHDMLMKLQRVSQIIYPKEIGPILVHMSIGNGQRIIEAGTGSGALTTALAYSVRPDGHVYSYDRREDMLNVARRNLERAGLLSHVELIQRDIGHGFTERDADALFLDVREPWDYLSHVQEALCDGGFFGALVPTTNQVSSLLAGMEGLPFTSIDVMEILVRRYKPVPQRLRPQDTMVGHTGFLIFARRVGSGADAGSVDEEA